MTKDECIKKACQVLRKRVRFDGVKITLPTTPFPGDDTPAIQAATRLYVETWIVPLLDSIESGDMTRIKQHYEHEKGHEMESSNEKAERLPPKSCEYTRDAIRQFAPARG